jgi:hypothetical protein
MTNLIAIAALAGFSSALLAAAAAAGYGAGAMLAIVAPLPLMIAAMSWHPLVALLGGALTSAALATIFRGSAGVVFAVLVMVPSYLAAQALWRRPLSGGWLVGLLAGGAALYAAFATMTGALSISLDFTTLKGHLLRQSELVYRVMSGVAMDAPLPPLRGQDPQGFIQTYANAVAPVSACVLALIYMLNIWLAAKASERSGKLPGGWVPVPGMRLPFFAAPLAVAALLGASMDNYLGLALELVGITLLIAFIALGYAATHDATRGMTGRTTILTGLWALTLLAGLPALLMLFAGLADAIFGWRDRVLAYRNMSTHDQT